MLGMYEGLESVCSKARCQKNDKEQSIQGTRRVSIVRCENGHATSMEERNEFKPKFILFKNQVRNLTLFQV